MRKRYPLLHFLASLLAGLMSWFMSHSIVYAVVSFIFGPIALVVMAFRRYFADGNLQRMWEFYFG